MKASRFRRCIGAIGASCIVVLGLSAAVALGAPSAQAPSEVPEADEFGVITSDKWAEQYPLEYQSYLLNAENVPPEYDEFIANGGVDNTSVGVEALNGDYTSVKVDYLADDQAPEIKTLGKGYGYAKYYTEPAGHTYSLWSISHNGRLGDLTTSKGKVSCFTCKTPQIHYEAAAYEGEGSFWTQSINDYVDHYTENVACANCHQNDNPTQLSVLRKDWVRAMGEDAETVPLQGQVCGQCHCDYSMAPATGGDEKAPFEPGEPTSPYYGGLESMTPESAPAFYDEYDFADWVYASTGAKMLAIRHAEFEFCYANGGNKMVTLMGYNCNDCHMGVETADDGTEYTSHHWQSPLDNPALLEQCDKCHSRTYEGGLEAWVKDTQADIDGRTHQLGLRAEQFIWNFEAKVAVEKDGALAFDMDTALANGLTEDQVAELQKIQREACYYWNLAAAENSEGVHNPRFYNELLDKGNELLDRADEILGVSSLPAAQAA